MLNARELEVGGRFLDHNGIQYTITIEENTLNPVSENKLNPLRN